MTQPRESSRRKRGTREDTESELLDAVLRLLQRDGVLAGISLREVAKEAGVNHGQIYQYFGTRQMLLRAAITRLIKREELDPVGHWDKPFTARRQEMWRRSLRKPDLVRLEALLALDDDTDLTVFPELERTRAALKRDRQTGELPPNADAEVMHAITAATYMGYAIFRNVIARDLNTNLTDLDQRAARIYDKFLDALRNDTNPE